MPYIIRLLQSNFVTLHTQNAAKTQYLLYFFYQIFVCLNYVQIDISVKYKPRIDFLLSARNKDNLVLHKKVVNTMANCSLISIKTNRQMSATIKGFLNASISGITFGLIPLFAIPVLSTGMHSTSVYLSLCLWLSCNVGNAYVSSHPNVACFWRFLAHIVSLSYVFGIVYHTYRGV